jgi:hypothetical protein
VEAESNKTCQVRYLLMWMRHGGEAAAYSGKGGGGDSFRGVLAIIEVMLARQWAEDVDFNDKH